MFKFLRQLFARKREETDLSASVEELWQTDFRKEKHRRFTPEFSDSYSLSFSEQGMLLKLNKKNVFAWSVNPCYEYRDFVLEALISFPQASGGCPQDGVRSPQEQESARVQPERAGTCAFGFLFRYIESGYYSVLVSDTGMVRMDAVFNGTPIPLLGWTRPVESRLPAAGGDVREVLPYEPGSGVYSLRIIACGTSFTLIVNDSWTACIEDDTIQNYGKIAFGGQNWNIRDNAEAIVSGIALDSRPLEAEALRLRWNTYMKVQPAARVSFAESLFATGRTVPAIIELKKAWEDSPPDVSSLLLAGRMYLSQRLTAEAEKVISAALEQDGGNSAAVADYAALLYLDNRTSELEDFLRVHEEEENESPLLSNLRGHLDVLYGRKEDVARHYGRAAELEPGEGLHFIHKAEALDVLGRSEDASAARIEGARLFLGSERYEELSRLVPLLEKDSHKEARAIAGKFYYAAEDYDKAAGLFEPLTAEDTDDSAVWYLLGLVYAGRNRRRDASRAFRKAAVLESEYGLYWFRLAESLFLAGEPCAEELEQAKRYDANNGWVWNLAAQEALSRGDVGEAEQFAEKARLLLPDELDALRNLAEIRRRQGRLDELLPLFKTGAAAMHEAANLLVEDGRYDEADEWYLAALKLQGRNPDILTDRAAACVERGELNEADALLSQALEIAPSPRIYRLIAYIAGIKGEYVRCEIAYRQGLEEFPESADLLYDLSGLYLRTRKYDKAREAAERFAGIEQGARLEALNAEIRKATTRALSCASCDRVWYVPVDIPVQPRLRLVAEPPDDLPAGTCPSCGKTFCIACAKSVLSEDGRFRCSGCGSALKLSDSGVIWLLSRWAEQNAGKTE